MGLLKVENRKLSLDLSKLGLLHLNLLRLNLEIELGWRWMKDLKFRFVEFWRLRWISFWGEVLEEQVLPLRCARERQKEKSTID